jgi:hypothetical protein
MVRLGIAATVALVGVVAAGVLGQVTDLPTGYLVAVGVAGALSIAWRGDQALTTLIGRIPKRVQDEIVYYGNGIATALNVTQLVTLAMPIWLHATLGALVQLLGLFGSRVGATPLSRPRDARGRTLVTRTTRT